VRSTRFFPDPDPRNRQDRVPCELIEPIPNAPRPPQIAEAFFLSAAIHPSIYLRNGAHGKLCRKLWTVRRKVSMPRNTVHDHPRLAPAPLRS